MILTYKDILLALVNRDAATAQLLPDTGPQDGKWGPVTENGALYFLDKEWEQICKLNNWRYTASAEKPRTSGGLRTQPIRRTIIHWPGASSITANQMDRLIQRRASGADSAQGSTHFSIDEHEIVCHCAPHRVAWHAQGHNWDSIGIDICVSPLDIEATVERGLFVGTTQWGGSPQHGNRWVKLHPAMAQKAFYLWLRFSEALGETSVFDHAFVDSGRKIDCIVWRDVLERQPWNFNQ